MLGYKEEDILTMMACINLSKSYLPPNASNDELRFGLDNAYSFLDGLLTEGWVQ